MGLAPRVSRILGLACRSLCLMGCGRVFLQDLNGFIIFVIMIEGCNGQVRMGHGGTGDATAAPLAVLGAIPVGFGEVFLTLLPMKVGCTRPSPVEDLRQ